VATLIDGGRFDRLPRRCASRNDGPRISLLLRATKWCGNLSTHAQLHNNMKTISILGSGWLGLPLAKHFVEQGYSVKASTRTAIRRIDIEATGATAHLLDIDNLTENIAGFLDSNILLVNITTKNIDGFKRLIEVVELSPVDKVIFVSSTSVYQNTNAVVTEASGAEDPQSPLFQIENLFRNSQHFQTTVIRFAGLIGYNRHPGRFFGERPIPQPDTPVNLIHRDDCINIIDHIIRQEKWGEVFNACADSHPSKREFYSLARANLGLPVPEFDTSVHADYKFINNEKLKQSLGYEFIHADFMTRIDL